MRESSVTVWLMPRARLDPRSIWQSAAGGRRNHGSPGHEKGSRRAHWLHRVAYVGEAMVSTNPFGSACCTRTSCVYHIRQSTVAAHDGAAVVSQAVHPLPARNLQFVATLRSPSLSKPAALVGPVVTHRTGACQSVSDGVLPCSKRHSSSSRQTQSGQQPNP